MPVARSSRRISSPRLASAARRLLNAAKLCAIATVSPGGRAHVNTAYFAWSPTFDLVWLSAPQARHSRNLRRNSAAAVAVYDSRQSWGGRDRGIQLFGSARELGGAAARAAEQLYARRFHAYAAADLGAYRFYQLRPRHVKLFDERAFGGGVFVTAVLRTGARITWARTEVYTGETDVRGPAAVRGTRT
jgi:uncharacterized protein YhbP (UPF0306 family)